MQTRIQTQNYIVIKQAYMYDVMMPVFEQIQKTIQAHRTYYSVAGKCVCIVFYSKKMLELWSPALVHISTGESDTVDLTVHVWDEASTQATCVLPWSDESYMCEPQVNTLISCDDGFFGVYTQGEQSISLYDSRQKQAFFWLPDATDMPSWISAAPLRTVLSWFLSLHHIYLVHGAVVGVDGHAVLLGAKGGSGKSTTALACVKAGMEYLSDDYVAIEPGESIRVHSLYNSLKIAQVGEVEKTTTFVSSTHPTQVKTMAALEAILIPKITYTTHTQIVPATKVQALLALIPTTMFQLPLMSSDASTQLTQSIKQLPCFFLELGMSSDEVVRAVRTFIQQRYSGV